jgi:hypothetical protein
MITSLVLIGIILMFVAAVDILGITLFAVEPLLLLLLAIACFVIAVVLLLQQAVAVLDGLRGDLSSRDQLVSREWRGR